MCTTQTLDDSGICTAKTIRLEAGKKKISPYKCINTRRGKNDVTLYDM